MLEIREEKTIQLLKATPPTNISPDVHPHQIERELLPSGFSLY
jgi:hypothetical protein